MEATVVMQTCTEPGCDLQFQTIQGVNMHITRMHTPRKLPGTLLTADEAFERVGAATEALLPDGVPTSRIIEVAEWQKVMLKWVTK